MRRVPCVVAILFLSPFALLANEPAGETPGMTKERPTEGRFVETDRGFMVPYTVKLPMQVGEESATFTMVPVPGGTFRFGSPTSEPFREICEGPAFDVQVEPFWIADKEVTWAEFQVYMSMDELFRQFDIAEVRGIEGQDAADVITAPSFIYEPAFVYANGKDRSLPAATMTQYAAKQYTKWLSLLTGAYYRLPTEAEWEYAARAGSKGPYFFGDDPSRLREYAWYEANAEETTHPVGQKKPSPWGLYDIYGNVSEWTLDAYTPDGYAKAKERGDTTAKVFEQPTELFPRTLRGGNYTLNYAALRSASRWPSDDWEWSRVDPDTSPWWFNDYPSLVVGFRIIRPLAAPTGPEERERFWKADHPEIEEAIETQIGSGRGSFGRVDPELPVAKAAVEKKKR